MLQPTMEFQKFHFIQKTNRGGSGAKRTQFLSPQSSFLQGGGVQQKRTQTLHTHQLEPKTHL